jgi:REP element-mobilizing transposase RayT
MENKDYFKKYYQKNREKILFRVKANYIKNKFTKLQDDNKDEIIKIKITKEPIIISFD